MFETVRKGAKVARSLWSGRRPASVGMLHLGRCGSTVLASMLHRHTAIYWDGELFERPGLRRKAGRRNLDGKWIIRCHQALAGDRWYGVELKFATTVHGRHLAGSVTEVPKVLKTLGFSRFVLLTRHNELRRLVSLEIGRAKRQWHIKSGAAAKLVKVSLPIDSLWLLRDNCSLSEGIELLQSIQSEMAQQLNDQELLQLSYEDDVQCDPAVGYRRICEFLGLAPEEVQAGTTRTNPFPLPDLLENYDEVAEHLRGTPHEWMLEED